MTKVEIRRLEMYRRVQEFGESCQNDFAVESQCRKMFRDLAEVVARLSEGSQRQSRVGNHATAAVAGKRAARAELLETMKSIQATSVTIARTHPGLDSQFAMPRQSSDEILLAAANGFAVAVEPLAAEFIALEMPEDFVSILRSQIDNFAAMMKQGSTAFTKRRGATKSIAADTAEGLRLVRLLEPAIRNKYKGNRVIMEQWEMASRVRQAGYGGAVAGEAEQAQGEQTQ
ncbi:MAG: hypothetical protein ACKV2V_05270 [Blastocatellia bacterium]